MGPVVHRLRSIGGAAEESEWYGKTGRWYVKDRDPDICGDERCVNRNLSVLTVERAGQDRLVCSLGRPSADGGWREVAVVVDSGAEETVAPPGLFPWGGQGVPHAAFRRA